MNINVKIDIDRAVNKLASVPDKVREQATVRALNKMADQVKVQAAREIRDAGYNLKVGKIKDAISIRRASRNELVARVRCSGKPIGLINYGARQTSAGVSVQVKSGRKIINHAFIATMPNGHKGVYIRKGRGHKKVMRGAKASWHGLPIQELFGPAIPSAFANQVVQQALEAGVRDKFPGLFKHELQYLSFR